MDIYSVLVDKETKHHLFEPRLVKETTTESEWAERINSPSATYGFFIKNGVKCALKQIHR